MARKSTLVLAIIAIVGWTFWLIASTYPATLEDKIDSLEAELNSVKGAYNKLLEENSKLVEENSLLKEENSKLKEDYAKLNQNYSRLKIMYEDLTLEFEKLKDFKSKYERLRSEYKQLKVNYSKLSALRDDYKKLKEEYEKLEEILRKGEAIATSAEWVSEDKRLKITSELVPVFWFGELDRYKVRVTVTNIGNEPLEKVWIFIFPYIGDKLCEWSSYYHLATVENLYMGESYTHEFDYLPREMTSYKVLALPGVS